MLIHRALMIISKFEWSGTVQRIFRILRRELGQQESLLLIILSTTSTWRSTWANYGPSSMNPIAAMSNVASTIATAPLSSTKGTSLWALSIHFSRFQLPRGSTKTTLTPTFALNVLLRARTWLTQTLRLRREAMAGKISCHWVILLL